MRILCLHGAGTGPLLMKRQISKLIECLDPSWEFYFLAGNIEGNPGPGAQSFPGPYLHFTLSYSPASIKAAHLLIQQTIEKEGPFDGALGFSIGAGLLASYLLEQVTSFPERPLPVQFGIFCSSVMPLSFDTAFNESFYGSLSQEDQDLLRSKDLSQIERLPEPAASVAGMTAKTLQILEKTIGVPWKDIMSRPISEIPCPLHKSFFEARLTIPTLHAYSDNDPAIFKEIAGMAESYCHPRWRQTILHRSPHNIPRSAEETKNVAGAIMQVVSQTQQARL